ncbi:MAG: protein kinase [Ignavibacteriae bacterium]|nr:protein kinase [Ignavibacteriota bacterium]
MIGTTVSHYKILEKLGEGGMGVVYKAEDTKLDRMVALKFLPPHLNASEQDKARFIQEAKAAATLNHPNICTIHDIQEHDGQMFIVMEFVDGQTLRDKKSTISFKQAVDIGIQIADGLAAAHEKGIVHRDIKPENIMIRKDGIAQIMDFGLAKLRASGSKITRLTKEGSTVGTAGYMSPEQVQGQDTDHRSDIFSYGVLLYELLTGQLPFKGVHETALAYEIVNVDPAPMMSVKPEIDPSLDAIVLECLAKEPDERTQSAKQVSVDLKRYRRESSRQRVSRVTAARPAFKPSSVGPAEDSYQEQSDHVQLSKSSNKLLWFMAAMFFIGMAAFAVLYFKRPSLEVQSVWSYLLPPEKLTFATQSAGAGEWEIALSPDGSMLAFLAADSSGKTHLMVRPLNALSAKELPATEGAYYPFWSPDNRFIGFFQSGKMKKIEAAGGPPVTICEAPDARGGSWSSEGVIVFAPTPVDPLSQVSAAGGAPVIVTKFDTSRHERSHRWPHFLPDGKHILYFARASFGGVEREEDALAVTSLDGKLDKRLMPAKSNIEYASGYLIYLREKTLMVQAFDANKLELSGDATPIAEPVEYDLNYNRAVFSVSQNGFLLYQASNSQAGWQLEWLDRSGKMLSLIGEPAEYGSAVLSPDEQRIAFDLYDPQSRNRDIWLYEFSRGLKTRFTFDPSVDEIPVWSSDGSRILFHSDRRGHYDLYQKTTSGAGAEEVLLESPIAKFPQDCSSDGRFLVYDINDPKTKADLWILPLTGERKPFVFLQTEFDEDIAQLSPDMHWIAYRSNESGNFELYVRPFMGADSQIAINQSRKWQVSTNGVSPGTSNQWWSRDGKELFYLSNDNKVMVAEVKTDGSNFDVGVVRPLFEVKTKGLVYFADVTADAQRFLMAISVGGQTSAPLTLVTNWDKELKKK